MIVSLGSYASKESATGRLMTRDIARVAAERSGYIEHVLVVPGEAVSRNQSLVRIRTTEPDNLVEGSGKSTSAVNIERIEVLLADLDDRQAFAQSSYQAQRRLIALQVEQIEKDLALSDDIDQSIRRRLALVAQHQKRQQRLVAQGAVAEVDVQEAISRHETVRQELASNALARLELKQKTLLLEQQQVEADHNLKTLTSQISLQRHDLQERIQSQRNNQSFLLFAPVDGVIDSVPAFVGGRAEPGTPLVVIKAGAAVGTPTVMLDISPAIVGFAAPGTPVIVRFDAFPYEHYGVVKGTVIRTTASTYDAPRLGAPSHEAKATSTYLTEVALDFGASRSRIAPQALKDGMTVTGTLRLQELTLLEWLFLPVVKGWKRNPDYLNLSSGSPTEAAL